MYFIRICLVYIRYVVKFKYKLSLNLLKEKRVNSINDLHEIKHRHNYPPLKKNKPRANFAKKLLIYRMYT